MDDTILQVRDLIKRFGGLVATDRCTLDIRAGEIHALIGPNGAGKTTLLAQLSGELASDGGSIVFAGRDITRRPIHERVAAGIVRSFQITTLFAKLTVRENLALAAQARGGRFFDGFGDIGADRALDAAAIAAARRVGLGDALERVVATLPHGSQRALELGLALACAPRLLLLDEPMAGTDPEESARMGELIRALRGEHTVVLVEHDMDAVFRLADRVSVLVAGRVIASGTPDQIRRDPQVIAAYLGDENLQSEEALQ